MKPRLLLLPALLSLVSACATAGSTWMARALPGDDDAWSGGSDEPPGASELPAPSTPGAPGAPNASHTLHPSGPRPAVIGGSARGTRGRAPHAVKQKLQGKVLGTFRNTYYDFPDAADFKGKPVELKSASCHTIAKVPRGFFEAVCVQGSGTLNDGSTVSFAKRDCDCADVCPRSGQKICFDQLDRSRYPWGRGATGKPITPLLTVAMDTNLVPLGTPVYIPDFDGVPRDADRDSFHDGCFIVQDRGMKVKGKHVDVFTGHHAITELWNHLVPSNKGVTVVLDSPHCARAKDVPSLQEIREERRRRDKK